MNFTILTGKFNIPLPLKIRQIIVNVTVLNCKNYSVNCKCVYICTVFFTTEKWQPGCQFFVVKTTGFFLQCSMAYD